MKQGNLTFILILAAATIITIGLAVTVEIYKEHFVVSDFGNIANIIQGTFGVAVSLAGAIVAIRLAHLSTMIIEKEKKREDSKFFHEIINEAILPIKKLTNGFQDLHFSSNKYKSIIFMTEPNYRNFDPQILDDELDKLKNEVTKSLKQIINSVKELTENQYAYSFWLYLTDNRQKKDSLLLWGGGARAKKEDYAGIQAGGSQASEFLIEDLNYLHNVLCTVLERFTDTKLTITDLNAAKTIYKKGAGHIMDSSIEINLSEAHLIILSLLSLHFRSSYYNRALKIIPDGIYFENKMLLLFIDIYHNLPGKQDLIGFAKSLFSQDEMAIIADSPITRTFDILNDAYWFGFDVIYEIRKVKLEDFKRNEEGSILGSYECGKIWLDWQLRKEGLYPAYTKNWE